MKTVQALPLIATTLLVVSCTNTPDQDTAPQPTPEATISTNIKKTIGSIPVEKGYKIEKSGTTGQVTYATLSTDQTQDQATQYYRNWADANGWKVTEQTDTSMTVQQRRKIVTFNTYFVEGLTVVTSVEYKLPKTLTTSQPPTT